MRNRFARLLCVLMAGALLLTGCASNTEGAPAAQLTLPPVNLKRAAPENDVNQSYRQTVLLYLPSLDGSQLIAVPVTATLSAARHRAETLCEMLFAHTGTDNARPVAGDVTLTLSGTEAVEVSGNVATVSLGASALRLSHEELFAVGQALANTLCQFGDLQYVNVLIAGVQPGLNVAATLPAGCFQNNTREDLATLWARASAPSSAARRSFAAALYYPAPAGKGILCEARMLSFSGADLPAMAVTLLEALSAGAESLPGVPRCPDFKGLLSADPVVDDAGGTRRLVLRFSEDMNAALTDSGITRSVMAAALTYTFTTFLPGIEGVEMRIGGELLTSLTPSGTYFGAGDTMLFQDGLMRRRDFSAFLLAHCTLFFANSRGKLTRVYRPIPFYETHNARALIQQLMMGPQPYDSQLGLSAVLPQGLRDADLIGVSFENNTLLLNFSAQLQALAEDFDAPAERRMVYALVNTLCELQGIDKAAVYILGSQPDILIREVFLPGDFLPNYNLIE
ncbi:MAG: GerMN domain-containing protein [Clostridia bacterium]|nr:GerMN domain-containing protein [Clostridia bacterium]